MHRTADAGTLTRARSAIVCLAMLLEGMSSSSINVQVGPIESDLALTGTQLQLVASAFLLAYAGLLPVAGQLADNRDRRAVFVTGIALFGAGCLACAAADGIVLLLAGRLLQGAGAALSAPAALVLITAGLDDTRRGRAIAVYAAMGAAGFSLGLVVPGAVVEWLGWRAGFLLFVPVVVVVLAATWTIRPTRGDRAPVDLVGAVLFAGLLVTAMSALGGVKVMSGAALAAHGAAAVALLLLLARRRGIRGFPVALLRLPVVAASCLGIAAVFAGVLGSMYVLSLWLATQAGAFAVGLLILPQPLTFTLLSGLGALLCRRIGAGRTFALGGVSLIAGLVWLGATATRLPLAGCVVPAMVAVGVALALCYPSASIAAVGAVTERSRATVTGVFAAAQNVGGATGLAVVTLLTTLPRLGSAAGPLPGMTVSAAAVLAGLLAAAAVHRRRPAP
ncbi:MFS transporter [Jiangella endophytica]|uniref:MFS transporter n=1 Tax=Jiangella endophytica TaxID=1623398 RepID=UPI001300AB88|nr:MFS transporter [Jiangella endophytica]